MLQTGQDRRTIRAMGLNAYLSGLTSNGRTYSQEEVEKAYAIMASYGLPRSDGNLGATLAYHFSKPQERAC